MSKQKKKVVSSKFNWTAFWVGVLACCVLDWGVDLLSSNRVSHQWTTIGGLSGSAWCEATENTESVKCVCDIVRTDDNKQYQYAVQISDTILGAFAHDKEQKYLCDDACDKVCFATAQWDEVRDKLMFLQ